MPSTARTQTATILYDGDCGFCKWSLSKVLSWDRARRLRPVALQDPESDLLLPDMDPARKFASWHLVTARGVVYSRGDVVVPLMSLLATGAPLRLLASLLPATTNRAYGWVAGHRRLLGRATRGRVDRAERRIDQHAGRASSDSGARASMAHRPPPGKENRCHGPLASRTPT